MVSYLFSDVRRGYLWLGHTVPASSTEISILHPKYKAGDCVWNCRHGAWPITTYVTGVEELLGLVRRYSGERMICYGINPRPAVLRRADGRIRSARETDLTVSQSAVIDIDLLGMVSPSRLAAVTRFLSVADEYFTSLGLQRPVRASSGNRGSHLAFAYGAINVGECPDVWERLRLFRAGFVGAVRRDLSRLEARVDTGTLNLRAMVKCWGTSKPGGGISRFYGGQRVEDRALREYLLSLPAHLPTTTAALGPLLVGTALPSWFAALLQTDNAIAALWRGDKRGGDTSRSGVDFSLTRALIQHGHRDPHALATILRLRPDVHGKGLAYVERTITSALRTADHPERRPRYAVPMKEAR